MSQPVTPPPVSAAPAATAVSGKRKKKKKKRFVLFILLIIGIWVWQNFTLNVAEETISSDKLTHAIKIAVLSDFHANQLSVSDEKILSALAEAAPDLVVILGDMYTDAEEDTVSRALALSLMQDIAIAHSRVYFVPGEHDREISYLDTLTSYGIHVMNYKQETIRIKENTIQIYGIDNAYFGDTFDLSTKFTLPADPSVYSILLAHIPMYDYFAAFGADLTICGDTHGGVVQIPFCGPIYYQGNWLPELIYDEDEVYDKGLFPYEGGNLFITSGIGNYPAVPARFNNRPEIAVLTITPEK